jgi:hypothetical protein
MHRNKIVVIESHSFGQVFVGDSVNIVIGWDMVSLKGSFTKEDTGSFSLDMDPCTNSSSAKTNADQIPNPCSDIVRHPQMLEVINIAQYMASVSIVVGNTKSMLSSEKVVSELVDYQLGLAAGFASRLVYSTRPFGFRRLNRVFWLDSGRLDSRGSASSSVAFSVTQI